MAILVNICFCIIFKKISKSDSCHYFNTLEMSPTSIYIIYEEPRKEPSQLFPKICTARPTTDESCVELCL